MHFLVFDDVSEDLESLAKEAQKSKNRKSEDTKTTVKKIKLEQSLENLNIPNDSI